MRSTSSVNTFSDLTFIKSPEEDAKKYELLSARIDFRARAHAMSAFFSSNPDKLSPDIVPITIYQADLPRPVAKYASIEQPNTDSFYMLLAHAQDPVKYSMLGSNVSADHVHLLKEMIKEIDEYMSKSSFLGGDGAAEEWANIIEAEKVKEYMQPALKILEFCRPYISSLDTHQKTTEVEMLSSMPGEDYDVRFKPIRISISKIMGLLGLNPTEYQWLYPGAPTEYHELLTQTSVRDRRLALQIDYDNGNFDSKIISLIISDMRSLIGGAWTSSAKWKNSSFPLSYQKFLKDTTGTNNLTSWEQHRFESTHLTESLSDAIYDIILLVNFGTPGLPASTVPLPSITNIVLSTVLTDACIATAVVYAPDFFGGLGLELLSPMSIALLMFCRGTFSNWLKSFIDQLFPSGGGSTWSIELRTILLKFSSIEIKPSLFFGFVFACFNAWAFGVNPGDNVVLVYLFKMIGFSILNQVVLERQFKYLTLIRELVMHFTGISAAARYISPTLEKVISIVLHLCSSLVVLPAFNTLFAAAPAVNIADNRAIVTFGSNEDFYVRPIVRDPQFMRSNLLNLFGLSADPFGSFRVNAARMPILLWIASVYNAAEVLVTGTQRFAEGNETAVRDGVVGALETVGVGALDTVGVPDSFAYFIPQTWATETLFLVRTIAAIPSADQMINTTIPLRTGVNLYKTIEDSAKTVTKTEVRIDKNIGEMRNFTAQVLDTDIPFLVETTDKTSYMTIKEVSSEILFKIANILHTVNEKRNGGLYLPTGSYVADFYPHAIGIIIKSRGKTIDEILSSVNGNILPPVSDMVDILKSVGDYRWALTNINTGIVGKYPNPDQKLLAYVSMRIAAATPDTSIPSPLFQSFKEKSIQDLKEAPYTNVETMSSSGTWLYDRADGMIQSLKGLVVYADKNRADAMVYLTGANEWVKQTGILQTVNGLFNTVSAVTVAAVTFFFRNWFKSSGTARGNRPTNGSKKRNIQKDDDNATEPRPPTPTPPPDEKPSKKYKIYNPSQPSLPETDAGESQGGGSDAIDVDEDLDDETMINIILDAVSKMKIVLTEDIVKIIVTNSSLNMFFESKMKILKEKGLNEKYNAPEAEYPENLLPVAGAPSVSFNLFEVRPFLTNPTLSRSIQKKIFPSASIDKDTDVNGASEAFVAWINLLVVHVITTI